MYVVFSLLNSKVDTEVKSVLGRVDVVIKRKDNIYNLCEIKFYSEEFTVDKYYHAKLVHRKNLFLEHIPRKAAIHSTLITTYGLTHNEYSSDFISVVTLDDLFAE